MTSSAAAPHLVLASASPRRVELLRAAGFQVAVKPAGVSERRRRDEDPVAYARRLARAKAEVVGRDCPAEALVLGADTVVVVDGQVLGKPASAAGAARMLHKLSGRRHQVVTAVCLLRRADGFRRVAHARTQVWMNRLTPGEIADYIRSGEPADKAGGYAIQGRAARFIPRIAGSYSNVVGLPLELVARLAAEAGRPPKKRNAPKP